jgi:GT2 family glycosyltransferase
MTRPVTVCICTRDRPEELSQALNSLPASAEHLSSVVVSDDGPSGATRSVAESASLPVVYTAGPRNGLAANRNHALTFVESDYVLFLDDDARLGDEFLEDSLRCMRSNEQRYGEGKVVVTGAERNQEYLVEPSDQDFLGFQHKQYKSRTGLKSVVINSTLFPVALTAELQFDRRLRYGSDEVDLATRMVVAGATIVYCPEAVNIHQASPLGRDGHLLERESSRLYATLKRYLSTERRPLVAAAFALFAPVHAVAGGFKRGGRDGARQSFQAVVNAAGYMKSFLADRRPHSDA